MRQFELRETARHTTWLIALLILVVTVARVFRRWDFPCYQQATTSGIPATGRPYGQALASVTNDSARVDVKREISDCQAGLVAEGLCKLEEMPHV
jgi:hypothetical protein